MHPSQRRRAVRALLTLALMLLGAAELAAPTFAQPAPAAPWRVGLQAGHWKIAQLPASLARLRGDTGAAAAGRSEVQLNLDFANRTAAILRAQGVIVDILPATVPNGYRADAFVAIHADGNPSAWAHGYKLAPPWRSAVAYRDAVLVSTLDAAYGAQTGLAHDTAVTRNMRGYYAMNTWLGDDSRISDQTPAAIIETGYMTSATDRRVLFYRPDAVAAGIAQGILNFLRHGDRADALQARAEAVAAASPTGRSVVVLADNTPVRSSRSAGAPIVARVGRGTSLSYLDSTVRPRGPFTNLHGAELANNSGAYRVAFPGSDRVLYVSRDAVIVQQPTP